MQYKILVKEQPNHLFSASALGFPDFQIEAETKEIAVSKAKAALTDYLTQGEIVTVNIDLDPTNPWLAMHGRLRDDPAFDEVMAEIEAFRKQVNDRESEL